MAVMVADTLKAKNGLDFPLVESQDVKGGLHCVDTTASRDALLTSTKVEAGMLVYVKGADGSNGVTYQLNDDMLTWKTFSGELSADQLQEILTYVQTNFESSKLTEEEGVTYLELL